ncbi:DUF6338 family protein [Streptomyces aquilus]|uniref:DUF6338 family protein n=1 Tax=Streptomyces aquilus TaxID=2548456 RepID=UPI0037D5EAFF
MPSTLAGLVLFVALLVPGYAYQRRRARAVPEREHTAFTETLSVVFVSVIVDWVVLAAFAFLAHFLPRATLDPARLLDDPNRYTADHFLAVVLWSAAFLAVAALLGHALAARPPHRPGRRLGEAQQSAWWLAFHEHPDATVHVGCILHDGSYVAGILHSYSRASAEHGDRDLTLRGEITYRTARGRVAAALPNVNLVVLSARDIAVLTVTYVRPQPVAAE